VPEPRKSPVLPIVVAVAAVVSLVAILLGTGSDGETSRPAAEVTKAKRSSAEENPLAQFARREAGDPMAKGSPDAPVVLIAYSEFQCPFCGRFARETAPALERKYVEDGTLRIEWRDFPYLGAESTVAARAGRAAAAQDSFWEFHDAMYARQLPPNSGNLDERYVEGIAERIGLDVEQFRTDMASDLSAKLVNRDFQEGQSIGVTGTPSFLVNGEPLVGAQPRDVFEAAIEDAAAAADS
jgi:protein-disulfide isomerase